MAVYFIRAAAVNAVKIGVTENGRARLATLRVLSPVPLEIAAFDPAGDYLTEAEAMWRFRADRLHGEWFRETPQLTAAIEETAATGAVPGGWHLPRDYKTYCLGNGSYGAKPDYLARRFDLTQQRLRVALGIPSLVLVDSYRYGVSLKHVPALYDFLRAEGRDLHYRDLLAQRDEERMAAPAEVAA